MSAAATLAGAAPGTVPDWHAIHWHKVWRNVRRLQARIVKATQEGRWGKVHALVYLLTHSYSGRAAAIVRVTTNQGASTPGVDGDVWDTPELKAAAFSKLRRHGYQPQPLRRVYIPKSSDPSKLRPLGIPTLTDRTMQALYLLGLDPIEETTADANSYGFRSGRSCADALDQCHKILRKNHSATWVLEGDIKKLWRWARRRHRHKPAAWVKRKYFTGAGDDRWRFRGTIWDDEGRVHTVFLVRARDTTIRRHVKIHGAANPYDPAWELYFEERLATQMANTLTGRGTVRYLWMQQNGRCLVCGQPLTLADGWQVHHLRWRAYGGDDLISNLVLLHPNCHRQLHSEGLVVEKAASREGRS